MELGPAPRRPLGSEGKLFFSSCPAFWRSPGLESKLSSDCGVITKASLPVMCKPRTLPTWRTSCSKTALLPLPAVAEPEVSVEGGRKPRKAQLASVLLCETPGPPCAHYIFNINHTFLTGKFLNENPDFLLLLVRSAICLAAGGPGQLNTELPTLRPWPPRSLISL